MLALLRRDPAVRSVPKWLLAGALTTSALSGLRAWFAHMPGAEAGFEGSFGNLLMLVLSLWIPVAAFLAFGNTGLRCSRFDLALPFSARRLTATHVAGVVLSGTLVLATAAGVVLFYDWMLGRISDETLTPQPGMGGLAFLVVTALILVVASLLSAQPGVYRTPSGRQRSLFVAAHLLAGLALILVLAALPLAVALLPLAIATALLARSLRALPAALTFVPLSSVEEDARQPRQAWSRIEQPAPVAQLDPVRRHFRLASLDATILRIFGLGIAPAQLIRVPINLIAVPVLAGMGLILSGFAFDNPIRLTNITLTAYMLIAFFGGPMAQLHLLDPLPISRRRLFALLILPGLVMVAVGYGAGRLGIALRDERPSLVFTSGIARNLAPPYRSEADTLRVPSSLFRLAWDGVAPSNEAPWGETHEAWQVPLFRGSLPMAYSPFSTTEDSSIDFVAWQISRAVEAVYGRAIPYPEIRERYLLESPDGGIMVRTPGGLTLLEDYPGLEAGGEGPVFPVVMLLTGVLWLLMAVVYFRAHRAFVGDGVRKGFFFGLLGVTLIVHVAQFVAFIIGFAEDWVVLGAVENGIRRLAGTLPGGDLAVWALCALLFAVVYRWALRAFQRIEVPLPRRTPLA